MLRSIKTGPKRKRHSDEVAVYVFRMYNFFISGDISFRMCNLCDMGLIQRTYKKGCRMQTYSLTERGKAIGSREELESYGYLIKEAELRVKAEKEEKKRLAEQMLIIR